MSVDFFFAGTQCTECLELQRDLNVNVLKSYLNDKRELEKWYDYRRNGWSGKLFVDSGAYSVHKKGLSVDVDDYIAYLNNNEEYITFYIQLDHIPGIWGQPRTIEMTLESCDKSWDNFKYMYERLTNPKKLCPVYHMGEPLWALDRILDSPYDFHCLCISCSKDIQFNEHFDWYDKCIRRIKNKRPNVRIHLLGVGKPQLKERLDMSSMDATNWIMTAINGSIFTPYGNVLVSDRQRYSPDCVLNMTDVMQARVDEYCRSLGYSLQEASENYKARLCINIKYLFNLSCTVEKKSIGIERRQLF